MIKPSIKQMDEHNFDFDIEKLCSCKELYWFNCYNSDSRYKKFITPESFAHPAKASFGLIDRIYKHLEELELLKQGDSVIDFMSGSGRINLLAAMRGYSTVAVELEPHFIKMIEDNKKQAEKVIGRSLDMKIIQGDSRKLSELLERGGVGVVSPPYTQAGTQGGGIVDKGYSDGTSVDMKIAERYGYMRKTHGNNPENIANLPDKPSKVGVVSPPYVNTPIAPQGAGTDQSFNKAYMEYQKTGSWKKFQEQMSKQNKEQGYSKVGVISPPYSDSDIAKNPSRSFSNVEVRKKDRYDGYSESKDNIGNLKDEPAKVGVISPPYIDAVNSEKHGIDLTKASDPRDRRERRDHSQLSTKEKMLQYSENQENLGNQEGESYMRAMLKCYQEAFKSGISPLITITKNPTREHKLRRLDLSTVSLLEQAGYGILDYHRAVLFKIEKNSTLDGSGEAESYKGRLSFFKRLSLQGGNVVASWEDIIIAVNPEGNFGRVGAVSPPYRNIEIGKGLNTKPPREGKNDQHGRNPKAHSQTETQYSSNPSNIGNLKD